MKASAVIFRGQRFGWIRNELLIGSDWIMRLAEGSNPSVRIGNFTDPIESVRFQRIAGVGGHKQAFSLALQAEARRRAVMERILNGI